MNKSQEPDHEQQEADEERSRRLVSHALHRLVLMRETGPKSARWERARRATIWRLLGRIESRDRQRK